MPMDTLESLRRKIDTATDLNSVVSTMKTLAAVSIRQYERAVEALADYSRTLELAFQITLRDQLLSLDRHVPSAKVGAVVLGSDQGMCGRFNEEIVSLMRDTQRQRQPQHRWHVLAVGGRVAGPLREAGETVDQTYRIPNSVSEITNLVQDLLPQLERWRVEANVSELLVFYNRRTSASSYQSHVHQMFPVDPGQLRKWTEQPWRSRTLPAFTMDRRRLVSRVVRQYLFVSLFRACAESLASENASRIAAMHAAEKNIEERLEDLYALYNHLRQTTITEELQDVVTGFEALASQVKGSERRWPSGAPAGGGDDLASGS